MSISLKTHLFILIYFQFQWDCTSVLSLPYTDMQLLSLHMVLLECIFSVITFLPEIHMHIHSDFILM